jgi:hypothetical protein
VHEPHRKRLAHQTGAAFAANEYSFVGLQSGCGFADFAIWDMLKHRIHFLQYRRDFCHRFGSFPAIALIDSLMDFAAAAGSGAFAMADPTMTTSGRTLASRGIDASVIPPAKAIFGPRDV